MANGRSDGTVYIDTRIDTSGIDKGMNNAGKKVNALSNSMRNLKTQIVSAFSRGINTTTSATNLSKLQAEIKKTEMQLDKLIEKQIRFVETGGNIKSRTMAGMEYDIEMTRNKLEQLRATLANTTVEAPRRFERMKKSIDKVTKSISNLNKGTKKTHMSLLRMLGTSLLFSTVFRAISTVTKGFGEGMNNIVQYSDEANSAMSALKSSLTQLKNSFAAAFTPILTAVTPALVTFINLISRAMNTVAAFFAALSGKSTYTKAVEVQENYREALEGTAEAAKEAKKYLTGLDEVRTYTADTSASGGGGVSPGDMFTEEEIDSPILKFAERVKKIFDEIMQYIKDGDWEGLGAYISKGIIAGFDFLSNLIDQVDWRKIGTAIGLFLKGLDWLKIIKSAFKLKFNIWKAIAEVWFGSFKAAPIETAVVTALAALKWIGVSKAIAEPLMAAIIASFVGFNIGKEIGKAIFPEDAEWYDSFSWFGEEGFFKTVFGEDKNVLLNALSEFSKEFGGIFGTLGEHYSKLVGRELKWQDLLGVVNYKQATEDLLGDNKRLVEAFGSGFIQEIKKGMNTYPQEVTKWWNEKVKPWFTKDKWASIMGGIKEAIVSKWGEAAISWGTNVQNWWNNSVKPWFTKEKWLGILGGIKSAFSDGFKSATNAAIDLINKFINQVNSKLNIKWEAFNFMGAELFPAGNFQLFSIPNIPKLATGAVIPPNAPFLAMLGDQRNGNNLEMPESLLRKVVREESGIAGGNGDVRIPVYLDGRVLLEAMVTKAQVMQAANGDNVFVTLGG